MAAMNIFYRLPSQRGTRVASIAGSECTLDQFCNHIIESEGLSRKDFIVASGTKVFRPSSCSLQSVSLQNNSHLDILIPLVGGKGGFGSLLRAIGARIEKTTNRDACRDLSGRRLRDVKREEKLKELLAEQEKVRETRRKRRKEKIQKLKKQHEKLTREEPIQELISKYDDKESNKRRLDMSDMLEQAIENGIKKSNKQQLVSKTPEKVVKVSKKLRLFDDELEDSDESDTQIESRSSSGK